MRIQAVSTGIPEYAAAFEAVIHSVFSSSVNLEVMGWDTLMAILASEDIDQPGNIRVSYRDARFTEGLYSGQKVICEKDSITIRETNIWIDLRQARRIDCQMPALSFPPSQGNRDALNAVRESLENEKVIRASRTQTNQMFEKRLSAGVESLSQVAKSLNLRQAQEIAHGLIGLGQGLTPSGDDILLGFLAGFMPTCGQDPARRAFLESFSKVIAISARETNAISRTYLIHASQGRFSTALIRLVEAICLELDPAEVTAAALRVLRTGHSSGVDIVTGLLAALK